MLPLYARDSGTTVQNGPDKVGPVLMVSGPELRSWLQPSWAARVQSRLLD